METNPIQYTSRTFNTILDDLNNDSELADKPVWFKRAIAGLGDVLSMYLNAIANLSYPRTAFSRQAVADLLALIDYWMEGKTTSSGKLLFYFNPDTVTFPKTILKANLAARSEGTISVASKKFEAREGVTVSALISEGFTTDYAVDSGLTVARRYVTGEKVRVSTDGTLPDPLQPDTDYYVIFSTATKIFLAETLAKAYAGTFIVLTDDGSGNHVVALYSVEVDGYQQESIEEQIIGTSDGVTEWQRFDLPDIDILPDTLEVTINGDSWIIPPAENFSESTYTDKHFLHRVNTDGTSYLLFGDGDYGMIPPAFDIYVSYATGGGINSNISQINKVNSYAGSDVDIVGVSNPEAFTGGADEESMDRAVNLASVLLKARGRFVTCTDGEALVLAYGGVSRVKINKNIYGPLSCQVPIVPSGGGSPSSTLKTAIQTYLINNSNLDSIDVRVVNPSYITVTPVAAVKILAGYAWATVQAYVILALRLLFSEVTYEIVEDYKQNGVASAVEIINAKWTSSFSESSYVQIRTLLDAVVPTDFGMDFEESSVQGFVDAYVKGVDYITISSPAFPVSVDDDEITTDNVLSGNITQIV